MSWRNKLHAMANTAGSLLLGCMVLTALIGCMGTVTPERVGHKQASFDGAQQNSGFMGWTEDGRGILTAHARDRYNSLIGSYGNRFAPALQPDCGLTATGTNTWIIEDQALDNFATMNEWRIEAAGQRPK